MTCLLKPRQTITNRRMRPALDTWPFLRLSNWDRTYADDVAEWLFCNRPDLALTFHNNGVGGSNIRDLLARFDIVPKFKPAWIILTIGNNDPNQGVTVAEFASGFAEYCRRAQEVCGARVMFLGGRRPGRAKSVPYHQRARNILKAHRGAWVDIGTALTTRAKLLRRQHELHTVFSDGTHLNAVGNLIVATQVLAAVGVMILPDA
jgi:lysophospholipase L1-like esterase